jgi:hypothetical protein
MSLTKKKNIFGKIGEHYIGNICFGCSSYFFRSIVHHNTSLVCGETHDSINQQLRANSLTFFAILYL